MYWELDFKDQAPLESERAGQVPWVRKCDSRLLTKVTGKGLAVRALAPAWDALCASCPVPVSLGRPACLALRSASDPARLPVPCLSQVLPWLALYALPPSCSHHDGPSWGGANPGPSTPATSSTWTFCAPGSHPPGLGSLITALRSRALCHPAHPPLR